MLNSQGSWLWALSLAVLTGGCVTLDPQADYGRIESYLQAAAGPAVIMSEEATSDELLNERIRSGITTDEAMRLCLLGNPRVRSAFLRIGIARAEVVQSGLFRNPSLALLLRFPSGGGLANLETSLAQNIADLWLLPARKRGAEEELEREILAVAREVSAIVLETRAAYFRAVSADLEREIALDNRSLARQLLDTAVARQQAGVASEIEVNLARSELMQTELAGLRAELAVFDTRRELALLLGLKTPPEELKLAEPLAAPPVWTLSPEGLLEVAQASRLDLRAADHSVQAAAQRLRQEKLGVLTDVEVGVSLERQHRRRRGDRPWLADTAWASAQAGRPTAPSLRPREKQPTEVIIGPMLNTALPVFDQNQAQIAGATYGMEQALLDRDVLLLEVIQEVRRAYQYIRTAWEVSTYYRDTFLPHLEQSLELSREAYRGGAVSLLSVLESQKSLLIARGKYVEALRDLAVAVVELEKAVGRPARDVLAVDENAGADGPRSPD